MQKKTPEQCKSKCLRVLMTSSALRETGSVDTNALGASTGCRDGSSFLAICQDALAPLQLRLNSDQTKGRPVPVPALCPHVRCPTHGLGMAQRSSSGSCGRLGRSRPMLHHGTWVHRGGSIPLQCALSTGHSTPSRAVSCHRALGRFLCLQSAR